MGIMLALAAWGIYLAIGATGMFIQEDMMDARKSGIVISCVALFLGLWSIVLFSKRKPADQSSLSTVEAPVRSRPALSKAGMTTLGLLVTGVVAWLIAVAMWNQKALTATTTLGWLAALCFTGSATAGIIALSAKTAARGKWFGLLGLIGFATAFIAFVVRMTP